jgi:hypothetical protein
MGRANTTQEDHMATNHQASEEELTDLAFKAVKVEDRDEAPLAIDLVRFVLWLRNNTDFFSGPDLDVNFPHHHDPNFYEVLGENALTYTGE